MGAFWLLLSSVLLEIVVVLLRPGALQVVGLSGFGERVILTLDVDLVLVGWYTVELVTLALDLVLGGHSLAMAAQADVWLLERVEGWIQGYCRRRIQS